MHMGSERYQNLVINPGSTSTKIGIFQNLHKKKEIVVRHTQEELKNFTSVFAEREFRTSIVLGMLKENAIDIHDFDGVIGIAGRIRPMPAGIIEVNEQMLSDLASARYKEHASNLGAFLAFDLAARLGQKAYVADAVTVDEMEDVARLSGIPEIERHGSTHTVNQKRMAKKAARDLGIPYEKAKLVVVHLGGGISVVAHKYGRMVDGNVPMGEGPFCIDRSGSVNAYELVKLCFSGNYTEEQMSRKIRGDGGVSGYLHTRDFKEVVARRKAGDEKSSKVFDAMAYQVAKEIGSCCVAVGGHPDGIVLTGGMAHAVEFVEEITRQTSFLGKIFVYPGEEELEALAEYLYQVQTGKTEAMQY